ncbi:hypothetical protein [Rhizobium sp. L245/93]|uniref:hypothetical protein n=1 Tax=Rhizobium sp. L245/93 TaxID=2819998 RepID=UPI001ADAA1F5|nr:hypothetical protein [Rhizobium sp. L245/93]
MADCNEVSDAMSLLSVAHLITGMLVDNLCQVDDTLESVEAVYIYAYLGRAIGFLETLLMRHDVTNGAVVN